MQSKKIYIVILGFIIIFGVVMFLALGVDNIKKNKQGTTLVIGNNTVWTYNKQRWKNISSKGQFQQFNWQEFTVFDNNEKLGNYNLWYDDKWYLFDKKKNAINYEGDLVAYQANYDINILKFEEQEIIDTKYVDYVLNYIDTIIRALKQVPLKELNKFLKRH